jgi:Flp pilus assembly pilin Flp
VASLVRDERGQDLVEYALLTAGIGISGIAAWPLIAGAISTAYGTLDTQTQNLWDPPPPGGP